MNKVDFTFHQFRRLRYITYNIINIIKSDEYEVFAIIKKGF